ncbi:hypothetical protein H7849_21495 [Alloacidobacterium dinghuense]|uniref:Uncharacterized protein n=1 Tax=Alloacidobacterium dinghuense TaxID=2763107 RepID=A0A7G8BGE1_9BACT|nr:hypothetical protein [Alloacidobacterium dinghuense]QNI31611.1 hypothetical protein H7849_21495 [Alloacidobacterium dinghuense]
MSTSVVTNYSALPTMYRRVRAYFAPVNRVQQVPSTFDPSQMGQFSLDSPPEPWIDLGWTENFARKSTGSISALNVGVPSVAQYQVREATGATVSFRFKVWNKLTMALSAGSQHMNLIQPASGSAANGSGAKGVAAVSVQAGSSATNIALNTTDIGPFSAGCLVTVDVDYAGQAGFVGSGVSAAYVRNSVAINNDPDYIRRVSFNVARVAQVTSGGLQLAQPLLAGTPLSGMKVQPIVGFVDREGGTFFQEWSAVFVLPGEQGERVIFHYPRLQAMQGSEESADAVAAPLERAALNANFRALPVTDSNDGELTVCFRSFIPGSATLI